jgi:DNA-binding phage protein
VIGALKEREATIGTLTATNKTLTEARDAILGVMEETKTSQEQLAAYLEFNALLQSSDPKDLEAALGMVEKQRTALYKALGRSPRAAASTCSRTSPT